jgi:flavin reductase (DIM6/NTAB) family NADH-FMN oxidoreductase RutF
VAERTLRPATVTADQYRTLMSAFPTGVAVVTAVGAAGQPCGMTCSSLTSVTLNPPMLLVCLQLGTRTERAVRASGAFAMNLLSSTALATAELFARPVADRFSKVCWAWSSGGLPQLTADAFAVADCAVTEIRDLSDHAVLFGRVERVAQSPDRPLLYGFRQYCAWNPAASAAPAGRPVTACTDAGDPDE